MLLSKLLRFIVLLASLISSIPIVAENVYTVTPTTILSPNLQYINTSELRQKTPKQVIVDSSTRVNNNNPEAIKSNSYTVREDKVDNVGDGGNGKLERSRAAALKLLDRRLIKR